MEISFIKTFGFGFGLDSMLSDIHKKQRTANVEENIDKLDLTNLEQIEKEFEVTESDLIAENAFFFDFRLE